MAQTIITAGQGGTPDSAFQGGDDGTLVVKVGTAGAKVNALSIDAQGRTSGVIVQGVAQSTTSGLNIDFTGIPSWAKRISVIFSGVSTNGSNSIQVQLGTSGGIQVSGYNSRFTYGTTGWNATAGISTGFGVVAPTPTQFVDGCLRFYQMPSNIWICEGVISNNVPGIGFTAGNTTLTGTLDRLRITAGGTDTFDAGSVNILYEG